MSVTEAPRPADTAVRLRTPHVAYLRYVADRDSSTLSRVFGEIVAAYAGALPPRTHKIEKVTQHVIIAGDHLAILDRLAMHMGVTRSEVARQLIDRARGSGILGAVELSAHPSGW